MKSIPSIIICLISYSFSYGQNNCQTANYSTIHWQAIDSISSYYICLNSNIKLSAKDSVEIEYLGIMENDINLVIQNLKDQMIFSLFTNTYFGKFIIADSTLPKNIRHVLQKMSANSECILKYNLSNTLNNFFSKSSNRINPIKPERRITVYFKDYVDSAMAVNWLREIKKKPFVDSVEYISKASALKNWVADDDTSWKSVFDSNPLPPSAEIYINEQSFYPAFLERLKQKYLELRLISTVSYPEIRNSEDSKVIMKLLTNQYLVRVRTK